MNIILKYYDPLFWKKINNKCKQVNLIKTIDAWIKYFEIYNISFTNHEYQKQKKLEETVRKIDVPIPIPPPAKIEKEKKIKKIIYESENSDEESEEVIIKKRKHLNNLHIIN